MDRRSTRPWLLALVLAACSRGSGSGSSGLVVRSISVPDFGLWESNRPIEFAFNQRIDFASVSGQSIRIRTSAGVPAAGVFAAKTTDANGDGVPETTDERVVVFYPRCHQVDDQSDAGFTPGARYLVTLAGADSGQDPASLLRSKSGDALARTVVLAFETKPAGSLHDEKRGAPRPLLRVAGASAGPGCHLELGDDPSQRVFFEAGPVFGRTPSGFAAPLNLFGDPATHVAFVVVFDQAIRAAPANLARLRLEYNATFDVAGWSPLEMRVELLSNCHPDDVAVRLVPVGTFPPGGFVRVSIEAGFEDLAGEPTPEPFDEFAITAVESVAFTSLDPPGAIADELREEFDFGRESPLSLADPVERLDAAPALWGQGELRANPDNVQLPPELREFDWVVKTGESFSFNTTSSSIAGGPNGEHTTVQETSGGLVLVRNMTVEPEGRLFVLGPNPMVVQASGSVSIHGEINADGFRAQDLLSTGTDPASGAAGNAGGGAGGSGSAGADARGGDGSAAFGAGAGGQGGESGFFPGVRVRDFRGGGGGGGRFASDEGLSFAQDGGGGGVPATGADSGLSPPKGGAASPPIFTDGDPLNDFFGVQPVLDESGTVVARRRGELGRIHGGMGGGSGGDSISAEAFPPPDTALVLEGGGGGGGGGALVIRALGPIVFGKLSRIHANGGNGGRRGTVSRDAGGSCGGSGSGGHVILESATAIDITGPISLPGFITAFGGLRIDPGGGALRGFGGRGSAGVVQLHVPHPERAPGDPSSNVILPPDALDQPDPLSALGEPRPHVLYPTVGPRSRALSRWIPLGAAGKGSASGPESVVAFLFDGIETAPGEDEGKVRTSGGRVVELAPVVGPVGLAQPGIELSADGSSLVLSGPVLAPLRASAQPISPDVFLRTPALLEGFTLRLANTADPDRRGDFTIAGARYDDASSRLTLSLGGLSGTLAEAAEGLGGADALELTLVPRFFRVRLGPSADVLPDSHSVRILFQGAADDGTGHADEADPLVDWTADVSRFNLLAPGALDLVRFQVEFDLDADGDGIDPEAEPLALDFLRLPMRF